MHLALESVAMQDIIVEKPYKFVPPHRGSWIPSLIQKVRLVDKYLSFFEGIESYEIRRTDLLKSSLDSKRSILLAPNHCRYADPLAMGFLAREAGVHVYAMASWHLFNQSRLQAFAIRMCGGFSVNREGVDRKSLETAIDTLTTAERPLVLFPEGTVFRSNDVLSPLLDGVSFLARTASKRRVKQGQDPVVIHPIAIKYLYKGDVTETIKPVLDSIEDRLAWGNRQRELPILERVTRIFEALLSLKEVQYFDRAQTGSTEERKDRLIDHLLVPLEEKLLGQEQAGAIIPRIKQLRAKLVPELNTPDINQPRRDEIWDQLHDIYMAQQVWSYPAGYLDQPTEMRLLETVESFEEDLTDRSRVHRPLHAILEVGEPIEADSAKVPKQESDPIMSGIAEVLQSMLDRLAKESKPI